MLNKADLREVKFDDLRALKDNQIPESHTLDYKRDFPIDRDGRLSLAADVVAFANTRGGDLILGVDEEDGVITQFVPIQLDNRDEALRSLQSALVDVIEPKVPGVHLAAVEAPDGGYIVVVRTPPSFQAPHRVRKSGVFYTRTSTGIDPMDITTLRSAFLQSAAAVDSARRFRSDRIRELRQRPLPAELPDLTLGVLHVLPVASVLGSSSFGISELDAIARKLRPPISMSGFGPRINLDGAMCMATLDRVTMLSYTQLFRNGAIESVMPVQNDDDGVAWIGRFENSLLDGHHAQLQAALSALGLEGPAFVMMSFVGIGGKELERPRMIGAAAPKVPPYYENLELPEIFVESFAESPATMYGPLFDLVWNAAGKHARPTRV